MFYTDFISSKLLMWTTKAVKCMPGGCTNTSRLLDHTLFDLLCACIAAKRVVSEELLDMIGLRRCSAYVWL